MATALIIGASSGIGRSLAAQLGARGYDLGLVARRKSLLNELASELPGRTLIEPLDVSDLCAVAQRPPVLMQALGHIDLYVYCAGVGHRNPGLPTRHEMETIAVNVSGFVNATVLAARFFERQGHGHIVGVSSVAAIRGLGAAPAYGASKAFMASYLEALYLKYTKANLPIAVTDVVPGFVDTAMAKAPVKFWVASQDGAAKQILEAIMAKKRKAYVTRGWQLFAWLVRMLPSKALAHFGSE